MRRVGIILGIAAAGLFAAAFAQGVNLDPTTQGGGSYTLSSVGGTSAGVSQHVTLTVPQMYGIAIDDATNLNFDLRQIGKSSQIACVTAVPGAKLNMPNPKQGGLGVYPLGTSYATGASFPDIVVSGGTAVATYPPIAKPSTSGGAIDTTSKMDIVCYKSFILEKFANVPGWTVTVKRSDGTANALGNMWVQDNICSAWSGNTGLYPLADGSTVDLFGTVTSQTSPNVYSQLLNTTGADAANCSYGSTPTSWLNDLVVLAIQIDGQHAGVSHSTLTYTIQATGS